MPTNFLGRLKNRPRLALAILSVGACAYAINRWYSAGIMAGISMWSPEFEQLHKQFVIWGDVAIALGIVAFVLILPSWPTRSKIQATQVILTATPEENIWGKYFIQCIYRIGIIIFGTFGLAVMLRLAANFLLEIPSSW